MMKTVLSKTEFLFYFSCMIIILTASYLLYEEFSDKPVLGKNLEKCADIYRDNLVQRKFRSQVIWGPIEDEEPVYYGDTIRTGEDSIAVALMKDGTLVTLDENSMVEFEKIADQVKLASVQGNLSIDRARVTADAQKSIIVDLDNVTLRQGKGAVRIQKDRGRNIIVSNGTAMLESDNKQYSLGKGSIVTIDRNGSRPVVSDNAPIPISPGHNSIIAVCDSARKIPFVFTASGENTVLEISRDARFNNIIKTMKNVKTGVPVKLDPGPYFWRISDRGEAAKPRSNVFNAFTILNKKPVYMRNPDNNEKIMYFSKRPLIDFSWEKDRYAAGYILEVSNSKDFKQLAASVHTPDNTISIDSLSTGTYFWRVRARTFFEQCKRKKAPVRSFTIVRKKDINKINLITPGNNMTYFTTNQSAKKLIFSCGKDREIDLYNLTIAGDKEMKQVVYTKSSRSNFIVCDGYLREGVYFWKIDGVVGSKPLVSSETRKFYMVSPLSVRIVSPHNRGVVITGQDGRAARVFFSWEGIDGTVDYTVMLYRDKSMKEVYSKASTGATSVVINQLPRGMYYWYLRITNSNGYHSITSEPRLFAVKNVLLPPLQLQPLQNTTINIKKVSNVSFSWKKRAGATGYLFKIYRVNGKSMEQLLEKNTTGTEMTLDIGSFGIGQYAWSLQSFDVDDNKRVLRQSSIAKRVFFLKRTTLAKPVIEDIEIQ